MKKQLFIFLAFAGFPAISLAAGTGDVYVSGGAGFIYPKNDGLFINGVGESDLEYGVGYSMSAALGFHGPLGLRLEGEGAFRSADTDNSDNFGNMNLYTASGNVYLDFSLMPKVEPYIGLGVGLTNIRGSESSDSAFSYQAMGGTNFYLHDDLAIGLEARYFSAGGLSLEYLGESVDMDFDSYELRVNTKYTLN